MNKIKVVNDSIDFQYLDGTVECLWKQKKEDYLVNAVKIIVQEDATLEIDYDILEDSKLDIFINVKENVKFSLVEKVNGKYLKIQYRYYLEKNSEVKISKTGLLEGTKEYTIINLNGEGSKIERLIKTVSKGEEQYDMLVYHNARNTESNLINHGVNIENGKLNFHVSSFVPEKSVGCVVNQNNRIVNLTEQECMIKPNMYIDCYDVTANHSAFVGAFKDYEMFYLQSRGITYDEALKLLVNGFLVSGLPLEQKIDFEEKIEQYWR